MKVRLMHPDRSYQPDDAAADAAGELVADLGVETMLAGMSRGDRFLYSMARGALFQLLTDPDEIRYRQRVLDDCIENTNTISALFDIAGEALAVERGILFGWHTEKPSSRLHYARSRLVGYVQLFRRLREVADTHNGEFGSPGFRELFAQIERELDDAYLDEADHYLAMLEFRAGVDESASLGMANEGTNYVLHPPEHLRPTLREVVTADWSRHTVTVAPRDMAGMDSLTDKKDYGLAVAAEALLQGADHVKAFFLALRQELGFYLACLNLRESLLSAGIPLCVPSPRATGDAGLTATNLCEPLLALNGESRIVGNDIDAAGAQLLVVTGANQGGKSTFLRSLGLAQLMMQVGMFVAAESFSAHVVDAVYSHFKREEDATLVSGKFDEELVRMSSIVDRVTPHSLLLCNESLSSTNEREAAEVGSGIIGGLLDCGIEVRLVTHLYEFAHRLQAEVAASTFLRATRLEDGTRSHKIVPGDPLRTSYGADLYQQVFGEPLADAG